MELDALPELIGTVLNVGLLCAAAMSLAMFGFVAKLFKAFGTTVRCTICDRSLRSTSFPRIPENSRCDHEHQACARCWQQWINVQIATRNVLQISCVQCDNTLGQNEIRAFATPVDYQNYLNAEIRTVLSADPDFRWCIAGCKSGQVHSEGVIFCCVGCGPRACVKCNVTWHQGETCNAYQARVTNLSKEEEQSLRAVEKYAKQCPGCGIRVQKNGGCDRMKCTQCGKNFCWQCLVSYHKISKEGNSAHKKSCLHWREAAA